MKTQHRWRSPCASELDRLWIPGVRLATPAALLSTFGCPELLASLASPFSPWRPQRAHQRLIGIWPSVLLHGTVRGGYAVTFLVVSVGGALGAVVRYLASGWVQGLAGSFFPWGTFAVNAIGSLALGFTLVWLQSTVSSPELREFIAIGFLGSFTTFSTFSYEALAMLRDGEWWQAGGYTVGSVVLCLLAVAAGATLAGALTRAGL